MTVTTIAAHPRSTYPRAYYFAANSREGCGHRHRTEAGAIVCRNRMNANTGRTLPLSGGPVRGVFRVYLVKPHRMTGDPV